MRRFERDGLDFVYATEESYGYLVEDEVRDKDGISAAAMTAEMTMYWRSKGKSLLQRLDEIFIEHGYHEERGVNKYFQGPTGMDVMRGIMDAYRKDQPGTLGGIAVERVRDIKTGKAWNVSAPGSAEKVDLPASDVIQWYLVDGTLVTVRPSGTEPKIKYYVLARTEVGSGGLGAARKASAAKVDAILDDIKKVIG